MDETMKHDERWTMADVLQAELDLMNQKFDDVHPVLQRSNALAEAIERAGVGDDDAAVLGLFDDDIIHSFHELKSLNDVLKERIRLEKRKLDSLQSVLDEHEEIHRLLVRLQQEQSAKPTNETTKDPQERNHCLNDRLLEERSQLRKDLDYVTEFIEMQRLSESPPTLNILLRTLIDRRLDFPDDPYRDLSTAQTNPLDLLLLRDAGMIETYKRTDLVCLIDYTATSENGL